MFAPFSIYVSSDTKFGVDFVDSVFNFMLDARQPLSSACTTCAYGFTPDSHGACVYKSSLCGDGKLARSGPYHVAIGGSQGAASKTVTVAHTGLVCPGRVKVSNVDYDVTVHGTSVTVRRPGGDSWSAGLSISCVYVMETCDNQKGDTITLNGCNSMCQLNRGYYWAARAEPGEKGRVMSICGDGVKVCDYGW